MATDFKFKLKEKVIAFFEQNSSQPATNRQIAEWIIKTYPNDCKQKMADSIKINDEYKLPSAISAEISSSLINVPHKLLREGLERVKIENDRGKLVWGFRQTESTSNTKTKSSKSSPKTVNPKPKTNKKPDEKEKRMYNPLIKFLESEREFWFLPIDHKKSS